MHAIVYISIPICLKFDLIVLNKCMQYRQLRMNNTPDGVLVFTMHAANLKYGS